MLDVIHYSQEELALVTADWQTPKDTNGQIQGFRFPHRLLQLVEKFFKIREILEFFPFIFSSWARNGPVLALCRYFITKDNEF